MNRDAIHRVGAHKKSMLEKMQKVMNSDFMTAVGSTTVHPMDVNIWTWRRGKTEVLEFFEVEVVVIAMVGNEINSKYVK